VNWARGIADDFWDAIRDWKTAQAMTLLGPEMVKALVSYERWSVGEHREQLIERVPPSYLEHLAARYGPDTSVSFESQDVAPDRTEVVLRGALSGKDRDGKAVNDALIMRVAKEANGGKWSIRFLRVVDRKKQ
jgi:hypothetical protein